MKYRLIQEARIDENLIIRTETVRRLMHSSLAILSLQFLLVRLCYYKLLVLIVLSI